MEGASSQGSCEVRWPVVMREDVQENEQSNCCYCMPLLRPSSPQVCARVATKICAHQSSLLAAEQIVLPVFKFRVSRLGTLYRVLRTPYRSSTYTRYTELA